MQPERKEKKALGKSFTTLISQTRIANLEDFSGQTIQNIALDKISPNKNQPRKKFAEEDLQDLVDSIKDYGVLQPILLKKIAEERYELIAGERRFQACKRLKLKEIPAIIRDVSELESLELAIIENIQRQNLSPIEEALAYHNLTVVHNYTQEQVAKRIGKSRSHIANSLRMLNLPTPVREMINDNQITAGHAKVLVSSVNPIDLASKIILQNLSVRETEKINRELRKVIKKIKPSKVKIKPKVFRLDDEENLAVIEAMLKNSINLPIKLTSKGTGVSIQIDCKNLIELDAIIQLLTAKGLNF